MFEHNMSGTACSQQLVAIFKHCHFLQQYQQLELMRADKFAQGKHWKSQKSVVDSEKIDLLSLTFAKHSVPNKTVLTMLTIPLGCVMYSQTLEITNLTRKGSSQEAVKLLPRISDFYN